jgi:hypothetical protein
MNQHVLVDISHMTQAHDHLDFFSLASRQYSTPDIDFKPISRLTAWDFPCAGLTFGQL